jgi:hypothetical protein
LSRPLGAGDALVGMFGSNLPTVPLCDRGKLTPPGSRPSVPWYYPETERFAFRLVIIAMALRLYTETVYGNADSVEHPRFIGIWKRILEPFFRIGVGHSPVPRSGADW